jgi:AP-1 complex subunit beta-1
VSALKVVGNIFFPGAQQTMTDSKYFTTTKKGEIFELKSELNNDKKEKKREAVKKASIIIKYDCFLGLIFDNLNFCSNL